MIVNYSKLYVVRYQHVAQHFSSSVPSLQMPLLFNFQVVQAPARRSRHHGSNDSTFNWIGVRVREFAGHDNSVSGLPDPQVFAH